MDMPFIHDKASWQVAVMLNTSVAVLEVVLKNDGS